MSAAAASESVIYLDNAATSWPKPEQVGAAMLDCLERIGGSPGRSGHRMAIAAARVVTETRLKLGELFNIDDPSRIVLTKNVTEALNIAIYGLVGPGDRVVTTAVEHNSVMRPLRHLEDRGAQIAVVPCSPDGSLDLERMELALDRPARLMVLTHASNVIGTVLPVAAVVRLAHARGVPVLVDAAQTAGAWPVDVQALDVDMLAFTGHKSLFGPTGTGGLWVREGLEPQPLLRGGTGSSSELEVQPDFLPDQLESGTLNVVGIAGLGAGVSHVLARGVPAIQEHERGLGERFLDGLHEVPGARWYGPERAAGRVGLASFNLDAASPSDVGLILDRRFGIMCRIGLHCAPAAHRTLGTYPIGTVRFAWSAFTTEEEIDAAIEALATIARG